MADQVESKVNAQRLCCRAAHECIPPDRAAYVSDCLERCDFPEQVNIGRSQTTGKRFDRMMEDAELSRLRDSTPPLSFSQLSGCGFDECD